MALHLAHAEAEHLCLHRETSEQMGRLQKQGFPVMGCFKPSDVALLHWCLYLHSDDRHFFNKEDREKDSEESQTYS